jgi:competence protein ComEC
MKRPLAAVVACYTVGLLFAEVLQPPLGVLFAIAFVVFASALMIAKLRSWLIWPLVVLAGWTNLASRTAVVSPNDLRTLLGNTAAVVSVRGKLLETPRLRIFQSDSREAERTLAQVQVAALRRGTNWQPAFGQIAVTTPGTLPDNCFAGQTVEINGVMALPPLPLAEGLFNYRAYLQWQGIYYELKTDSANDWVVLSPGKSPPLSDRFIAWARKTMTLGLPHDLATQLMPAMTLGQKAALTDEVSEPFMRSGTMHIFAISGLHIALIAGILLGLLRVFQLPRLACGLIVLPLIWFYTAATGWQPSAIRSTIMMSIIIGGWSLKRPSDLLNSLAAAAFIILVWDPQQLFQASFQLSFFVVLSIALIAPRLNKLRDRLLQSDPLLPPQLVPRWRRWLNPPLRFVTTCFTTSLAAWLGSLPLTAFYFHLFSPVTLLANLIIVPLASLALMANLGSLLCGFWLPWATELFNNSGWFFMSAMIDTSESVTKLPGAFFYVPAPMCWSIAIYFAALIGMASGWLLSRRRRVWSAAALVLVVAGFFWRWEQSRDETKLTVLPLNGGHCVFVDAPGRENDRLVDCGNENAVEYTLKQFLRGQGVDHVQHLILTYGSLRNVGGADLLNQLFGVGEVETSSVHFRSRAYRKIVAEFERPPGRHKIVNRGDTMDRWHVLHPAATNDFSHADDNALVLLGDYSGAHILLLSDLGRVGQDALLSRTNDLHADIVVTGLPIKGQPLCNALLNAIQPKVIVVADSKFPATRRASRALKKRLAGRGVPVIYTRTAGAVTILANSSGWKLRAMDGQEVAGEK